MKEISEISTKEKLKLQSEKIKLANKQKRENKQRRKAESKAAYEASLVLSGENKDMVDTLFNDINLSNNRDKISKIMNLLDCPNTTKIRQVIGRHQIYVSRLCPEFKKICLIARKINKEYALGKIKVSEEDIFGEAFINKVLKAISSIYISERNINYFNFIFNLFYEY